MRLGFTRSWAGPGICCLGLAAVLCASAQAAAQDKVPGKLDGYKAKLKELENSYRKILHEAVKEATDAEKTASELEKKLVEELSKVGAKDKEKRQTLVDSLKEARKELLKTQEARKHYLDQLNGFRAVLGWDKLEDHFGAVVKAPTATLIDQLGLAKGEGMVVEFVPAKSLAARVGLKPHDVVLKIGAGIVPNDGLAYKKLVNDIKTDAALEVTILRHGKQVVLTTSPSTGPVDPVKKAPEEKKVIPEKKTDKESK